MEWVSCKNSKHIQVGEEIQFGVDKFFLKFLKLLNFFVSLGLKSLIMETL